MKTTGIRYGDADKLRCTIRLSTTSGVSVHGSHEHRTASSSPVRRAVAVLGAVTLFGFLTLHAPTVQAVTCQPVQRGTLSGSTFTAGDDG